MSYDPRRFLRNFALSVTFEGRQFTVTPPFRIEFSCTKSVAGLGLNKLTAKIYGLGPDKRRQLVKNAQDVRRVQVELAVGYEGGIETLFRGDLHKGFNELNDDGFVTTIEVFDGGFDYFNSYTSRTVSTGGDAMAAIISDMPNTEIGRTTPRPQLTRPKVLVGSSSKLIEDTIGQNESFYIDEGRVNVLKENEVIGNYIPEVSAQTGLINTPTREFSKCTFETLMNPFIRLGGRVSLVSLVAPELNGVYRVDSIIYSGDSEGNDWKQAITGFLTRNVVVL